MLPPFAFFFLQTFSRSEMIHLSRLLRWNFLFIAAVVCCVRVKLVEGGDDNGLGIQYDWKKSVSADDAQTSDKPVMVIIHRAGCPGILVAHRGFSNIVRF